MSHFEIVSKYKGAGLSLPTRGTGYAAGYDFCVAEDTVIPSIYDMPHNMKFEEQFIHSTLTLDEAAAEYKKRKYKPVLVPTGIKCELDAGSYLELSVRSSSPLKYWLVLANGVGIIDGDYYNNPDNEGEIFFQLINLGPYGIKLKKGDKIGQGIIKPYYTVEGDFYGKGDARVGGFGSTTSSNATITAEDTSNVDGWGWIGHPVALEMDDPQYSYTVSCGTDDSADYYVYNKETGQLEPIENENSIS